MFDIAPLFREVLSLLPLEALTEMEESLSVSDSKAIQLAIADIQKERASRQTT